VIAAMHHCAQAPIVLSVNAGYQPESTMNRISSDVWDVWGDVVGNVASIAANEYHAKPGHWPDADMLPLGRIGGMVLGFTDLYT
jgi:hypothetical protein